MKSGVVSLFHGPFQLCLQAQTNTKNEKTCISKTNTFLVIGLEFNTIDIY